MENVWIDSEILEAIGDALRYQYNTDKKYYPYEMAEAIKNAKGVGTLDDYFGHEIVATTEDYPGWTRLIKKIPKVSPFDLTTTSFQNVFNKYPFEISPIIDSKGIKNFSSMFYSASIEKVLPFDTSEGTNFSNMFANCTSLTIIPQLDTSNGTNFSGMFSGCFDLATVPLLDMHNAINVANIFSSCSSLQNLGGFLNLGQAYSVNTSANSSSYQFAINASDKISYKSLINVINNLYDIATKGCKTQQLQIGWESIAKLTAEEITIATNKGWSVS